MGTVRYQIVEMNGKEIVEEIRKIIVHQFELTPGREGIELNSHRQIEDILHQLPWSNSDEYKFIKKHAKNIDLHYHHNVERYSMSVAVIAELEAKKLTEYYLKWGAKWK